MTDPRNLRTSAQKSAQSYFTKADQSETLAKQIRKKERTAGAAKIARLRELRLAKEAADKEAAPDGDTGVGVK